MVLPISSHLQSQLNRVKDADRHDTAKFLEWQNNRRSILDASAGVEMPSGKRLELGGEDSCTLRDQERMHLRSSSFRLQTWNFTPPTRQNDVWRRRDEQGSHFLLAACVHAEHDVPHDNTTVETVAGIDLPAALGERPLTATERRRTNE